MTPLQWQERWVWFKEIEFPMVPLHVWPRLRHDLLTIEQSIACHKHDVGCVKSFWFDISVPEHVRIHHKPTALNAE